MYNFPHPTSTLQASCLPRATVLELWDELLTSRCTAADLAGLSVALLELREKQLLRSNGQQLMWLGEGKPWENHGKTIGKWRFTLW